MRFLPILNHTIISRIGTFLFFLFCAAILAFSIRGLPGNPSVADLNTLAWKDNGPFELSPERGRFALLYSIIENNSFSFAPDLARFTTPDLAYHPTKGYVSLFAPAVSFVVMPGYLIGRYFGAAQLGTFAVVAFFALLNVFLIRAIAIRIGANPIAAMLGGFAFLFASPAFAYAVNLYQHHISTFLILLSVYLLIRFNTVISLVFIWILYGFSLSVDYPNFFLMFPIAIAALGKTLIIKKEELQTRIGFSVVRFLTVVTVIMPLFFFFWFNIMSYGNPLQVAGGLNAVIDVAPDGSPIFERITNNTPKEKEVKEEPPQPKEEEPERNVLNFFDNRNLINGFFIHFFSPDRGMIVYAPVMFLGIIGIGYALKKRQKASFVLMAILGTNILLYSMWGDPYGGWAFGSRYLIPSYAILGVFLGIALTQLKKSNLFLLFFFLVLSYSFSVNTMGAITSSRNPPQVQIAGLEKESGVKQEYTFVRNAQMLSVRESKAFVFKAFMHKYISAWNYFSALIIVIIAVAVSLILSLKLMKNKHEERGIHEI